jgi:hypothetical protein
MSLPILNSSETRNHRRVAATATGVILPVFVTKEERRNLTFA